MIKFETQCWQAKRNSQARDSAKRDFFFFFHVGYAVHGVQHWEYLNFEWENYIFVVLSITSGSHEAGLFYAYCGLLLTGFDLRCSLYSTDDLALLKPFKALNKDFSFSVFLQSTWIWIATFM